MLIRITIIEPQLFLDNGIFKKYSILQKKILNVKAFLHFIVQICGMQPAGKQSFKRNLSLFSMPALYIIAGIFHFILPVSYLQIMPPWLPYPKVLVEVSGFCEIVFGSLLIPSISRCFASRFIIALLVAIFPANIQMTINYMHDHNPYLWLSILRLPLQIVLIFWALKFTKNS
jgi:uncharacterized membrane protein